MQEHNISAKKFMEYYGMTEDVVPESYIQKYINEYDVKESKLENSYCDQLVLACYKKGTEFGYNLANITNGKESNLKIRDFISQTQKIIIEFYMRFKRELTHKELMIIDFDKMKIYYSPKDISLNYKTAEKCESLFAKDKEKICKKFISCIAEEKGMGNYGASPEYSFIIRFVASDKTKKTFLGDEGDEEHFPGFDIYWKELFLEHFGEEYRA